MRQVVDPVPGGLPIRDVVIATDGGPWAEHDYSCPVCSERHAILDLNSGTFQPCGRCQQNGWTLIRRRRWWRR